MHPGGLLRPKYHQTSRLGWKPGAIWSILTIFRIYFGVRGVGRTKIDDFLHGKFWVKNGYFWPKMAIFDPKSTLQKVADFGTTHPLDPNIYEKPLKMAR